VIFSSANLCPQTALAFKLRRKPLDDGLGMLCKKGEGVAGVRFGVNRLRLGRNEPIKSARRITPLRTAERGRAPG